MEVRKMKRIGKKLMYMALSLFVIFQVYLFIRFYWIVSCFIPRILWRQLYWEEIILLFLCKYQGVE